MIRLPPPQRLESPLFVFDPLSASDRALAAAIMASPHVVNQMRRAWRMTLASGLEHSFFIYKGKQALYTGTIWTGGVKKDGHYATDPRQRWEQIAARDSAVANYHTHPTYQPTDRFTDWQDLQYNFFTNTLGFLQTHFGLFVGRTGHRAR